MQKVSFFLLLFIAVLSLVVQLSEAHNLNRKLRQAGCRRHISSLSDWENRILHRVHKGFRILHKMAISDYRRTVVRPPTVFPCKRSRYIDEGEEMYQRMHNQFGLFIKILDVIRTQDSAREEFTVTIGKLRKNMDRLVADVDENSAIGDSFTINPSKLDWRKCLLQMSDYGSRFSSMLWQEDQCTLESLGSLSHVCSSRLAPCGCRSP